MLVCLWGCIQGDCHLNQWTTGERPALTEVSPSKGWGMGETKAERGSPSARGLHFSLLLVSHKVSSLAVLCSSVWCFVPHQLQSSGISQPWRKTMSPKNLSLFMLLYLGVLSKLQKAGWYNQIIFHSFILLSSSLDNIKIK